MKLRMMVSQFILITIIILDRNRTLPIFVKCIESLGSEAASEYYNSYLQIVEVPDDIEWCIRKNSDKHTCHWCKVDGCKICRHTVEYVEEIHRTWHPE